MATNLPGYINNKKGFVVSRIDDVDFAYVLKTTGMTLGTGLSIKLYKKNSSAAKYNYIDEIYPEIPFRMMFSDSDCLHNDIFNGTSTDVTKYNPGGQLSYLHNQGGIDGISSENNAWNEINLRREQIERIPKGANCQRLNDDYVKYSTTQKTELYITNAGALVKPVDTNTDKLLIFAVTKVDAHFGECKPNDGLASYFVPYILLYNIDKNNLTRKPEPIAWTFGYPTSNQSLATPNHLLGRIKRTDGGFYNTKCVNMNVIPGTYTGEDRDSYFWPGSLGVLLDCATDGTNLFVMYSASRLNKNNFYRYEGTAGAFRINNIWDESSGFFQSTGVPLFTSNANIAHPIPASISCEYSNGYYCGVSSKGKCTKSEKITTIYSTDMVIVDASFSNVLSRQIDGIGSAQLTPYDEGFSLSYIKGASLYIYYTGNIVTLRDGILGVDPGSTHRKLSIKNLIKQIYVSDSQFEIPVNKTGLLIPYKLPTNLHMNPIHDYIATPNNSENLGAFNGSPVMWYVNSINDDVSIVLTKIMSNDSELRSLTSNAIDSQSHKLIETTASGEHTATRIVNDNNYVDKVIDYKNSKITIGDTATFYYSKNQGMDSDGINVLLSIPCSGIFPDGSDFVQRQASNIKGVPIDYTRTREDLVLKMDGIRDDFVFGASGYWATLTSPSSNITVSHPWSAYQVNNTYDGPLSFVAYDNDGNCYIEAKLTLYMHEDTEDLAGNKFGEEGFSLENLTVDVVIDTFDKVEGKAFGTLTTPPVDITIVVSNSDLSPTSKFINKTIYLVTSKGVSGSEISSFYLKEHTEEAEITTPLHKHETNINTRIQPFSDWGLKQSLCNIKKGDYFYITWKETIGDVIYDKRSGLKSYVAGHRYIMNSDAVVKLDTVDKTAAIFDAEGGYIHLGDGGSNVNIEVDFDIIHETFTPYDDIADDSGRYPTIESVHLMVVPKSRWSTKTNGVSYEEDPPTTAPTTYPNGGTAFFNKLDVLAVASASNSYAGVISQSDSIDVDSTQEGDVQIFLAVKDEFNQYSVFHITSTDTDKDGNKTYRTNFS